MITRLTDLLVCRQGPSSDSRCIKQTETPSPYPYFVSYSHPLFCTTLGHRTQLDIFMQRQWASHSARYLLHRTASHSAIDIFMQRQWAGPGGSNLQPPLPSGLTGLATSRECCTECPCACVCVCVCVCASVYVCVCVCVCVCFF